MDSNYNSLGQYYKNQSKYISSENFSVYNSGKFDIGKIENQAKFQVINVDSSISNMSIQPASVDGQLTVKADRLPNNFEIKSFDIFNNENGVWVHNTIPITSTLYRYVTYDNKKKEIYIGVPAKTLQDYVFNVNKLKTPSIKSIDGVISGSPFIRIYITW